MRQSKRLRPLLVAAALLAARPPAPAEPPSSAHEVERLIDQLGDPDYHAREAAEARLAEFGYAAFDALSIAERHPDPEIAARARYLLRQITVDWNRPDDPEPVRRAFEGYDGLSLDERLKRVEQLYLLPADQGLAGLCRIVRFERNELLAKRAAMAACSRKPATAARAALIRREAGAGPRLAARWLQAYCMESTDAAQAAALWGAAAAEERRVGQLRPEAAPAETQAWLERRQASLLRRAGQPEEARQVIAGIVDREPGDPESLERLVDWLVSEEAWSSIDAVAQKFDSLFDGEPMLIYSLAQARRVQGRAAEAEELAEKAAGLRPDELDLHAQSADRLRRRGQTRWAEKEYRLVIDQAAPGSFLALGAQRLLAEMLHDALDFGRAADVLDVSIEAMRENIKQRREGENGSTLEEVVARALYLRAEHRLEQADLAGRRELLVQALEQNPLDIDVLIALSGVKDLPPETRTRVAQRIEQAAGSFRAELTQSPLDGTPYNQLAWLLANTGGDLDEALDCSRRSLELQPEEPAFLDTLGRVYYARGDFEAAIEHQSRAVELSPHSGLMRRQLELFQRALEKSHESAGSSPVTE